MWPDYNLPVKVLYSDNNINLTNTEFNFRCTNFSLFNGEVNQFQNLGPNHKILQ